MCCFYGADRSSILCAAVSSRDLVMGRDGDGCEGTFEQKGTDHFFV
jgi:hypothetical protein